MNKKVSQARSIILILVFMCTWAPNKEVLVVKGDYLGQNPPGRTPEVFAPGVVSTNKSEFDAAKRYKPGSKDW